MELQNANQIDEEALKIARVQCDGVYPYTIVEQFAKEIQQYAESHHAKKCAECKKEDKCNSCDMRYSSY